MEYFVGQNLLLVGSVPLNTVEEVMRVFGGALARHLPAVPDGEVGERLAWVNRFCWIIFNGHSDIETLKRPRPVNGVEVLRPRLREDTWQFRVKPGVERVRFGAPGQRLGYARDAVSSYFVFRTLREKGIFPADMRFQISLPMVNSVVRPLYFPDAADLAKVRPGFEEALAAEIAVILARVPNEDLAIQWDCAWEISAVYGAAKDAPGEADIATHTGPIERLSRDIPDAVKLGFHFCFGTFGGWPAFAPTSLDRAVALANAAILATRRRVDWVHVPTLDTTADEFYAPLADLDARGARVYLGAIHNLSTLDARLKVARKYLPDFGLAAYCGFGRTPAEEMPAVLADHLRALDIAGLRGT
jgi:hypothetical protein